MGLTGEAIMGSEWLQCIDGVERLYGQARKRDEEERLSRDPM